LANELDCAYVSFATSSHNNKQILDEIKNIVINNVLKNDDIIIVMLTYPYRGGTNPISDFIKMEELLKPYRHFYFNGFYPMFKHEIYLDIPDYFIDSERSMLDMLIDYEQKNPNCEPIWEYSRRIEWNDESRNKDTIYHPNMFGYKLIGKHIYSKIKDKKIDPNNKIKNNKLL
jgi:hypothetical protein